MDELVEREIKDPIRVYQTTSLSLRTQKSLIGIFTIFTIMYCVGIALVQWDFIFDDSFITYRYSNNLARGYGITWNQNEPPVEGYTNFLLVITLVPFILIGIPPLLATRFLSLVSAGLLLYLLFRVTKEKYKNRQGLEYLLPVLFLLSSNTIPLVMVGLETVLFSASVFFAFIIGSKFLKSGRLITGIVFGGISFLAFLFRPEAILLPFTFGCAIIYFCWKNKMPSSILRKFSFVVLLSFAIPLILYLVWKFDYFGTIVPNSFHIKVPLSGIYSEIGLQSINVFFWINILFVITALISFLVTKEDCQGRVIASLFCVSYTLFYVRVDTLMDIYNRFLYPIIVFLIYLSIPTFNYLLETLSTLRWNETFKAIYAGVFLFSFTWFPLIDTVNNYSDIINGQNPYADNSNLMQREFAAAMALRDYPGISKIKIAFGDAGVIPFFTDALSLDTVGLNDMYIAREKDFGKLTKYFFNQKPDLILQPANHDFTWLTYGHGPLGNYSKWSSDVQWDNYAYIGTIKSNVYDIHMFLSREMNTYREFKNYIQNNVIDGVYESFPIQLGSYSPNSQVQPNWISIMD